MRKDRRALFLLVAISAMMVLIACGGGGGGGGGGHKASVQPDGTFVKKYSPENAYGPMYSFAYHDDSTAIPYYLYNSTTLEDMSMKHSSGYITAISLQRNDDVLGDVTCPTLTIKMGHSTAEDLTTTEADNYENGAGALETVFDGSYTIPAGDAEAFFTVPLKNPFYFNGEDNLVVTFDHGSGCDGDVPVRHELITGYASGMWALSIHNALVHVKFQFEGGVDRITQDGSSTGMYVPFSTDSGSQKVQLLYQANEIHGSGLITGMALKVGNLTTNEIYTLDIKMGHTSLDALVGGSDFANNFSDTPVTVASGAIWNVPAGVPAGEYVWLPFPDGAFKYDGVDNLIVEINVTSASGNFYPAYTSPSENRRLYGSSGAATSSGAGNILYVASFRFRGGTMDVITPRGLSSGEYDNFPFFDYNQRRQLLYLASELGTAGTINKLYCHLAGDSTGATFGGYKIRMAHTTSNVLSATWADNLLNPVTVFNGSFAIPAGMKKGDWVSIPLSKPFNYNGKDNLVVDYMDAAGTVTTLASGCVLDDLSTTLYDSRRVYGTAASASGTVASSLQDIRFGLK